MRTVRALIHESRISEERILEAVQETIASPDQFYFKQFPVKIGLAIYDKAHWFGVMRVLVEVPEEPQREGEVSAVWVLESGCRNPCCIEGSAFWSNGRTFDR